MEYKLTFEDGSDGYLAHHGIKGMKWGVRNAETLAKYAGGTGRRIGTGDASSRKSASGISKGYGRAVSSTGRSSGGALQRYNAPKLTDEQKEIMKKAAIGLGTAAAIGGGVYLAKKAADAGLDKKLKEDLQKVRQNEGARLRTEADIVKENIFRNALDKANQTKDGVNFKANRSEVDDSRKRAIKLVAGTTRYFATRDNPVKARQNAASFIIDGTDRGDVYRLVDATLNYKAASSKARANYAKGKKVVDTLFAAGKGAAKGAAAGTVLGTAASIASAKSKKNKTAISKTTGRKYIIKSTNPDPKKYEVWDPTLSKSENLEWNKEHKGN